MYTLFIDTHDKNVVIILYKDNSILDLNIENSNFGHSQITLPRIKEMLDKYNLKPQDLNTIAVVIGPGSFTGIRIGVTIAKTLAYTLNIPIKTIDSLKLKAIAYPSSEDFIISMEDKNGAYIGKFNKDYEPLEDYKYLSKKEYDLIKDQVINIEPNYQELIKYINLLDSINPHKVNPIYIKRIAVEK